MTDEQVTPRRIGVEALKALAHPLRVQLFSELTSFGPATASALAARLGESSGSTSYHLRQLEKHGFVREDETRGNGRDRWWERVPGPIELADAVFDPAPGAREAGDLVEREFIERENRRFADYWMSRAGLPEEWVRATQTGSTTLRLTAEELARLGDEVWSVVNRYVVRPSTDGAERVDLQFRGFPVVERGDPVRTRPSEGLPERPDGDTVDGHRPVEGA